MCKLPFGKHSSSKAPLNWKKRKFFSLFYGIHGARREDTEGGDQEAIPPAPPGQISHRDSKKPERVIVKGEVDCSQPIICEPGAGRAAESSERSCCRHGSRTQDLTLPSRKHVRLCVGCGRCQQCAGRSVRGSLPRCGVCRSRSPLLELPTELHMEMVQYLDFPASWLLRLSSKYFYESVPAPIGPWDRTDLITLLSGLRLSVPRHLTRCDQCLKYHSSSTNLQFTYTRPSGVVVQYCLRAFERIAMIPPGASEFRIESSHDICRHCWYLQTNSPCRRCGKCEFYVRIKLQGHSVECRACDTGTARCMRCWYIRLSR
jgi:hypothetical protein